jgi:hypothetical protein
MVQGILWAYPLPDRGHGVVADHQRGAGRQHQDHQQRVSKTPQPPRVRHPLEPVEQRRRDRQRVNSHRIHTGRVRGELGFPQRQISEVVNDMVNRGR